MRLVPRGMFGYCRPRIRRRGEGGEGGTDELVCADRARFVQDCCEMECIIVCDERVHDTTKKEEGRSMELSV